ncbi:MAG: hypothetical protein J0J01_07715 [Reyranella sp.]|uniref:hypothetical protein n=1 Tax=Reyranella sp. TaxID=1929291 RepID=UPI001AC2AAFB|nr:hypothetical protein [Reyranella sp.]MBN9086778.1 hypothetical protein [Reyranella sp.]
MTDRPVVPAACALLLLGIAVGCTPDGQSVSTSVPASVEPLDFAALNGKTIRIEGMASGDFSVIPPETKIPLRVIGKTIVWGDLEGRCILKGTAYGSSMGILYTLDQPRTGVKVPCEGQRRFVINSWTVTAPADVSYSSSMGLQGNVLELSGELTEHNTISDERLHFTATEDIKHQQHVKVRVSGDKCQVLEFAWTTDKRELHSSVGRPTSAKRSVRATGCSIVAQPS